MNGALGYSQGENTLEAEGSLRVSISHWVSGNKVATSNKLLHA